MKRWVIEDSDPFKFDNIGFCKTTELRQGLKYLCCADCEVGPLGFQELNETEKGIYVDSKRVIYK